MRITHIVAPGNLFLSISLIFLTLIFSCKDEDTVELAPPAERIIGIWSIQRIEFMGAVIEDDGSYLEFMECLPDACPGESYNGNDDEFGPFEYVLNSEGDSLIIIDPSTIGGGWGGDWAITRFTENELNVRMLTVAGEAKMYLVK